MLEGLPLGALINGVSAVGLVILFALALGTNWLYTRGQVRAIVQAHQRELERIEKATAREVEDANHERQEWRTEARLNQQTIVELNEQNRAMLSAFGPTLTDFLDSLRNVFSAKSRDEESDRA